MVLKYHYFNIFFIGMIFLFIYFFFQINQLVNAEEPRTNYINSYYTFNTKTRLFKYFENFTTQTENSDIFFIYFCSNHRLWVLVRIASPRRPDFLFEISELFGISEVDLILIALYPNRAIMNRVLKKRIFLYERTL